MNELGKIVKKCRAAHGLTQAQLATAVRVSTTQIAQIEQGKMVPQPDNAARMDDVLGAGGEIVKAADTAREDATAPWLRPWALYEQQASMIRTWEPTIIPGLLQTEAYARAIIAAGQHTPAQVDDATALRLARQAAVFDRPDPITLSAIMGESALRYGDPVMMRGQFDHLCKMSERPGISIRVVPYRAGIHDGLAGAFALATIPGRRPVGYLDDQRRGRVVADADDIRALEWTWEALSARALPITETRTMIERLRHEHT